MSSDAMPKTLYPASSSRASRSSRPISRIGSTTLTRHGSGWSCFMVPSLPLSLRRPLAEDEPRPGRAAGRERRALADPHRAVLGDLPDAALDGRAPVLPGTRLDLDPERLAVGRPGRRDHPRSRRAQRLLVRLPVHDELLGEDRL